MGDEAKYIRFDSPMGFRSKARTTPQGFRIVKANITRTGVLTYRRNDGSIVRELRHPDHVFNADSMESLRLAPLTDLHPAEGFVSIDNAKDLSKGLVSTARQDGRMMAGEIVLQDKGVIAKYDSGELKELSPGYTCTLDFNPGVYNGERYDAIQKNIIYNHVAALPAGQGRSGPEVAFRADSKDPSVAYEIETNNPNGENMDPEENDGILTVKKTVKVDMVEASEVKKLQERLDSLTKEADALKAENVKLTADHDIVKTKLDAFEKIEAARVREALEASAKLLAPELKFDAKMTDEEIRLAAVKAHNPKLSLDGKDSAYIASAFEISITQLDTSKREDAKDKKAAGASIKGIVDGVIEGVKKTDADESAEAARLRMNKENRNAWRPKA